MGHFHGAGGVKIFWQAWLPEESAPVKFSTHGAVAAHYGAKPGTYEPHATTLDYLVAAAAG